MSEDENPAAVSEEDPTTTRQKERARKLRLIKQNIDPLLKRNSPLYELVEQRIETLTSGRCRTFGETNMSKDFAGWLRTAGPDDKPKLEVMLALFAAWDALASVRNDTFGREVEKRKLREWAREQLRIINGEKPTAKSSQKGRKTVKVENDEGSAEMGVNQRNQNTILPSVERDSDTPARTLPNLRPGQERLTSSEFESPARTVQVSKFSQATFAPATKRQRVDNIPTKPEKTFADAKIQTDEEHLPGWAPELINDFTKSIQGAFITALTRHGDVISETFPERLKGVIQDAVADEAARYQAEQSNRSRARMQPSMEIDRRPAYVVYENPAMPPARGSGYDRFPQHEAPRAMETRYVDQRVGSVIQPLEEAVMDIRAFKYVPSSGHRGY